jgi:hypothetical protein
MDAVLAALLRPDAVRSGCAANSLHRLLDGAAR